MPQSPKVRVLVLGRQTFADKAGDAKLVSEVVVVGSAEQASASIDLEPPDLIFLDFEMPGASGHQRLERLKKHSPKIPVIGILDDEDLSALSMGLAEGASGFVTHEATPQDIDDAVRVIKAGGTYLDPVRADIMMKRAAEHEKSRNDVSFSQREEQVIQLLSQGLSARQIASRLQLSERTVNAHVANVYRKLGVTNRVEAVRNAIRMGIVSVGE
ncbi:MAG TPA: response regulator transcription factor [Actinomycetota bacterium]|nr:response regulator transcription factor [Actinomycetota bacterium]